MKKILKNKTLFAVLLAVILLFALASYIVITDSSYCEYFYEGKTPMYSSAEVTYSVNGIVEDCKPVHEDGYFKLQFNAIKKGSTNAVITLYGTDKSKSQSLQTYSEFHVGVFNILYKKVNGFIPDINGYPSIYITIALYFIIMGIYMIFNFADNLKKSMYSYKTIFNCSLMILLCGFGITYSLFSIILLCNYQDLQISNLHNITTIFLFFIVLLSLVFVFIYSCSMTASNISLIIHEGFRFQNLLGIIISICLTIGVLVCATIPFFFSYFDKLIFNTIYAVIATMFIFLEIFLLSTKICALIAAKHTPAYDKDYIIILGCGIKKDGTLLPLLKGRVDKAIDFYKKQFEQTGKKAVFVPSGGQGSDEIISEGEAMKRYLLEQGIPEEKIMPETKSTNTLENMKFSKEIIGDNNAKVAFSTTNYHVFRGGMFANQVNMDAEGMGSRTKWYFWPNAFIREFVGLIVSQKKRIITVVLTVAVVAAATAYIFS